MTYLMVLPSGDEVLVDDEDFDELNKYKWCATGSTGLYAVRYTSRKNGQKKKAIYMHNQLMNHTVNKLTQVDHIDGNGLNNQKFNLEVVTVKINTERKNSGRKDPFGNELPPGIYYEYSHSRWLIKYNKINRGRFNSFQSAVNGLNAIIEVENGDDYGITY